MRGRHRILTGAGLASIVSARGRRGIIKSIQRNTITLNNVTSNTATINAVDPNNAVLNYLGFAGGSTSTTIKNIMTRVELTNSTTVTATVNTAIASNHVISFEVVEYFPGIIKSLQRGTISASSSPGTATITAVDTTKSIVGWGGYTTDSSLAMEGDTLTMYMDLQNSTTVRFTQPNMAATNWVVPYQVVEFY